MPSFNFGDGKPDGEVTFAISSHCGQGLTVKDDVHRFLPVTEAGAFHLDLFPGGAEPEGETVNDGSTVKVEALPISDNAPSVSVSTT